jgi:hypothetical protein
MRHALTEREGNLVGLNAPRNRRAFLSTFTIR